MFNMNKDNVEEFIRLYNILDDLLRDKFKEFSRSFSMIQRYIDKLESSSNKENFEKARQINMIRILRNNLVHEFDMNSKDLLIISDETIDFLNKEIEELKNPITANDIMTKISNLYYVDEEEPIENVLDTMIKKGFTQIPILKDGYLIGVFSPNVLFLYMAKNKTNLTKNLKIKDFIEFIPLNKHISEKYEFIPRDYDLDDILDVFDKYNRDRKKLVCVFVSEHGKQTQKLLGMIVPSDLIR